MGLASKMVGQLLLTIGLWFLNKSNPKELVVTSDNLPQARINETLQIIQMLAANFGVACKSSPGNLRAVELIFNRPIFIHAPEIRIHASGDIIQKANKIWLNPPMLAGVPIANYDYYNLEDNCRFTYLVVPYDGYLPKCMPLYDYNSIVQNVKLQAIENASPSF